MECGGKIEGLGDLSPVPGRVFVSGSSSDGQSCTSVFANAWLGARGPGLLFLLMEQISLKPLMVHFN